MLTCSLSDFSKEYLPFLPDAPWVDRASAHLTETRMDKLHLPVKDDTYFSCGSTAPIEVGSLISVYLEALRDKPCCDVKNEHKWNGYGYMNCPDRKMKSDTPIADFNVDAVIAKMLVCKTEEMSEAPSAERAAIPVTFQLTSEQASVNQRNLEFASTQIMNDDPRRNFLYGVSIEGTVMSLWYFSRDHSIKSQSFDFTKEFETFVRVFLSFLYATEEELGYDVRVLRMPYNAEYCYVYKLETPQCTKYFKTLQVLYHPHASCITRQKCRVWKAIEVKSPANLTPIPDALPVALKDTWVTQESASEKKIQELIFDRLSKAEENDFDWAPNGLKQKIKDALAGPEAYFVKVKYDWKEAGKKEKENPKDHSALHFLSESNEDFNIFCKKRGYKVLQRYLVVYSDVGESLALATSLSDAVRAFEDIFIAMMLLFLARWVHRDVSESNIILVHDEYGVRAKLNDLEYARSFNPEDGAASTDSKTGTPYFMPVEIHKGETLVLNPPPATLDVRSMTSIWKRNQRRPELASPSVRYNFAHDVESLWWIIVWIILRRTKGAPWLDKLIFAVFDFPHPDREAFFRKGDALQAYLEPLIHDSLCERHAHTFLAICNYSLLKFYSKGERQKATSYHNLYSSIWDVMEIFVRQMSDVKMELEDPDTRVPPWFVSSLDSQEIGKRLRSRDDDGAAAEATGEDSSSRKKHKSDADGLEDTDAEDTAEEDTAEDMASIIREDSNPRITIRAT